MQRPTSPPSEPLSDDDLLDLPDWVPINQSEILAQKTFLAASISETGNKSEAATQTSVKQVRSIGTQTDQGDWFCCEISATVPPAEIEADHTD